MAGTLEGLELMFGEAEPEWNTSTPPSSHPFLFNVEAIDNPRRLRFQVSDFHCNTFQTVRTIDQLEDLRDTAGIGGSWDDFVDYLKSSLSSGNVKLALEAPTTSVNVNGATFASLTAQKLKGMPRISLSLENLTGSAANDAMGNIGLKLYRAFKNRCEDFLEEQGLRYNLSIILEAERDKNRKIQDQLESFTFSKKRKDHKTTSESPMIGFDAMKVSGRQLSSEKAGTDPNKPKRPASAFFVYMEELRKTFMEENPNNKSVAAVGKAGGDKWKSMSEAEKAPFAAKAAKRMTEYDKKMAAYNKKQAAKPKRPTSTFFVLMEEFRKTF